MADYPTHAEVAAKIAAAGGGGGSGATSTWISWSDLRSGYGNVSGPNGDGFGIGRNAYVLPESGTSSIFIHGQVPAGWATMAIDLYCYVPSAPGGNMYARLTGAIDADGSDVSGSVSNGGTASAFAAPTAALVMTARTLVTGLTTPTAGGLYNAFFERAPANAADTSTADLRVHGFLLRKQS